MNNSKMYLVTFRGVPDWERENCNSYCERKYLFDSPDKASEFVRNRTKDIEWETHPACMEGSMGHRIKKGDFQREDGSTFRNEYITVVLGVNEDCEQIPPPNTDLASNEEVDKVVYLLREMDAILNDIQWGICTFTCSNSAWQSCNHARENILDAIHNAELMRPRT